MANKPIEYLALSVPVTHYVQEGTELDALRIVVRYSRGRGFCLDYTPVLLTSYGFKTGPLPSRDPLIGGGLMLVEQATKNSSKRLMQMHAAVGLAKNAIAYYFDKRLWGTLNDFLQRVAKYGYNPAAGVPMRVPDAIVNYTPGAAAPAADDGMMERYRKHKARYQDALLLFKSGDVYQILFDDAKVCADVLGLTYVVDSSEVKMCQFAADDLNGYLPRLIRAGYHIHLCDNISEVLTPKDETAMRLNLNANSKSESKNVQAAAQVINPMPQAVTVEDAEFEEVVDVTPTPAPAPKAEPKPKAAPKAKAEPEPDPEAVGEIVGLTKVELKVYKTKKGADAPMLVGFTGEDDPRWAVHRGQKYVSAGWREENGEKVYRLLFGTRYMDVAKALCEAYNTTDREAWKAAEQACSGNYDTIVSGFKAEKEQRKAERAAAKAAKAASKAAAKPATKGEETYTLDEVARKLAKLLPEGEAKLDDIKKLLKAA